MPAPEIIQVLVKRFADNISYYKSKNYNEAQLRQEFLDPFFEALGWDIYNKKDYAPRYREVIVEKPISFLGSQASKTPDYTFRLGEDPKFFVEAKRPSENLQASSEFAFQLKAYSWNKHLPLSILTDFEEFLVFDCRRKPTKADRPDVDCVMKLAFTDYIKKWDELISIFSPVSIRKGAFDKYAEDNTSKKGVSEVDDEFLKDISNWRELLARNIALRNQSNMDESNLNYAVQMTIDRIIFLRICEDRGIEPFNQLRELADKPEIYQNLKDLFKRAELKYNSGLFTFNNHKKEHNTHQDNLTPSLAIDDKVLKQIITGFYYPASTYNFKAIPVEILGQVYEQFLGKVIRLTPGHQAKIEEKPEVRKAGGVYYTPKYIVDYIVANTVGKLLEGKTPDQVSQLRIVDPACGSGSFLLGAFQYLMDWHEEYYLSHDPQQWVRGKEPALAPLGGDEYRLSTPEKKRILINNIYGVDIDAQAVEVTKLSLLLKVLEEETGQLSLGLEHALPDLGNNIKCGNSLIGWDYFEGQLIPDEKEVKRVNPFNWQDAFPEVFAKGGFDAVIGNPPYGAILTNAEKVFLKKYSLSSTDTAALMMINSFLITKQKGYNGFIVPKPFLYSSVWEKTRTLLINDLQTIVDVSRAWKEVLLEQVIYTLQKGMSYDTYSSYKNIDHYFTLINEINKKDCTVFGFIINNLNDEKIRIGKKAWINSESLNNLIKNTRGGMFQKKATDKFSDYYVIGGKQLARYKITGFKGYCSKKIIYDYPNAKIKNGSLLFQNIIAHIQNPAPHIKIIGNSSNSDLSEKYLILDTINQFDNISSYSSLFLLGLLHSKFLNWYVYLFVFANAIRTMHFDSPTTGKIPVPKIDFSNKRLKTIHDRIVSLVEHMLELHKRTPQTPHEQEMFQREIASTDAQIDRLVYELYGLTEEEIKIVEGL